VVITQTYAPNLRDATKTCFTPDEDRAIEETAEERHEYCNGEIIAISGASEVHSAIACGLLSLPIDSDDRVVWRLAQSNQMILLTANRSMKGENSLFTSNSRGNNFYITPRDYY
jgi:Uma2 family endonuclease